MADPQKLHGEKSVVIESMPIGHPYSMTTFTTHRERTYLCILHEGGDCLLLLLMFLSNRLILIGGQSVLSRCLLAGILCFQKLFAAMLIFLHQTYATTRVHIQWNLSNQDALK